MQHYKTAYELKGLDALDLQLVLDTDSNQAETDIRWDGEKEDADEGESSEAGDGVIDDGGPAKAS